MADCVAVDQGLSKIDDKAVTPQQEALKTALSLSCPSVNNSRSEETVRVELIKILAPRIKDPAVRKTITDLTASLASQFNNSLADIESLFKQVSELPKNNNPAASGKYILARAVSDTEKILVELLLGQATVDNLATVADIAIRLTRTTAQILPAKDREMLQVLQKDLEDRNKLLRKVRLENSKNLA